MRAKLWSRERGMAAEGEMGPLGRCSSNTSLGSGLAPSLAGSGTFPRPLFPHCV